MTKSRIEWTNEVWNPTTGCSHVTSGCKNCYAERITKRFRKDHKPWTVPNEVHNVVLHPDRLTAPLHWRKPRMVFVDSMSDLFHWRISNDFIDQVFAVMAMCPQHTFQILTKRADRMFAYMKDIQDNDKNLQRWAQHAYDLTGSPCASGIFDEIEWPVPNVWLGVSTENQSTANERIPLLLKTPAAIRFLSCEPLLGPITPHLFGECGSAKGVCTDNSCRTKIDWVICGGESGPGARPMHPDWALSLRDQCVITKVPFFFKQWGDWMPNATGDMPMVRVGKKQAGRLLNGKLWNEYPVGRKGDRIQ